MRRPGASTGVAAGGPQGRSQTMSRTTSTDPPQQPIYLSTSTYLTILFYFSYIVLLYFKYM